MIVDDDYLVRAAIEGILAPRKDIVVVAAAASGAEAVVMARAERPEVVLMDVQLPGMDGIQATRTLLAEVDTQVVAMTSLASVDTVQRMLEAGAYGFVLKDAAPDALADAVLTVARGDAYLSPRHTRALVERLASDTGADGAREAARLFAALSDRERDAARLVAAGATDGEIAERMYLAPSTVKSHIQQVRVKFGVRNRTQIGVIVERAGETPA
ncbi:MAG: response regulator [Microcella sp.]